MQNCNIWSLIWLQILIFPLCLFCNFIGLNFDWWGSCKLGCIHAKTLTFIVHAPRNVHLLYMHQGMDIYCTCTKECTFIVHAPRNVHLLYMHQEMNSFFKAPYTFLTKNKHLYLINKSIGFSLALITWSIPTFNNYKTDYSVDAKL